MSTRKKPTASFLSVAQLLDVFPDPIRTSISQVRDWFGVSENIARETRRLAIGYIAIGARVAPAPVEQRSKEVIAIMKSCGVNEAEATTWSHMRRSAHG